MSESMMFCLGHGKSESTGDGYQKRYCIFNKQLTEEEWLKEVRSLPVIKLKLTKKEFAYEGAWKDWWKEASKEDKDKILDNKYFNAQIFTEITGIRDKNDKRLLD